MSTTNSPQPPRYSMLIEWSEADQAYIVSLPEWERAGALAHAHGTTYAEAAHNGEELIAFLWRSATQENDPVPPPVTFDEHAYAPGETAEQIAAANESLAAQIEAHPTPTN